MAGQGERPLRLQGISKGAQEVNLTPDPRRKQGEAKEKEGGDAMCAGSVLVDGIVVSEHMSTDVPLRLETFPTEPSL